MRVTAGRALLWLMWLPLCDRTTAVFTAGSPDNHMFIHFLRFGSKPCCYDDLSTFIPLLSAKQKAEFLKEVRSVTRAEPVDHTPSEEDSKKNVRGWGDLMIIPLVNVHLPLHPLPLPCS